MNLQRFFDIAWERHRIYVKKTLGCPKPWTTDDIFLDNYFCNVFRRIDKTSQWIVDNAIQPNEGNPALWKTIIMCRYISRIDTLQYLQDHNCLIGDQQGTHEILRQMQQQKRKIFTNAFIVNSKTSDGWMDKVSYLFKLLSAIHHKYDGSADFTFQTFCYMREMFDALHGLPGVGDFMAYQYTVDFSYSKRYLSGAASKLLDSRMTEGFTSDSMFWTVLGLGAVRGMNRLLGNAPTRHSIDDELELARQILVEWTEEVQKNLHSQVERTAHEIGAYHLEPIYKLYEPFCHLKMADVQHWLCEYDKYVRGGSKKRRYYGRS